MSLLSELAVEAVNIEAEISKQTKEIETLGVSSEQANEFTDLMNKNRVECTTKIKMISSSNSKTHQIHFWDCRQMSYTPPSRILLQSTYFYVSLIFSYPFNHH